MSLGKKLGAALLVALLFSWAVERSAKDSRGASSQPHRPATPVRLAITDPACTALQTDVDKQACQERSTEAALAKRRQEEEEERRKAQERAEIAAKSWNFQTGRDAMSGKAIEYAWVQSRNTLSFDFPYGGAQRATLRLRKHPQYGRDVILSIEKGQFSCGYDDCSVRVRFDDGNIQTFSAVEPADHSTETLFIQNYDRFVSQARKAKEIRIQATFFQNGSQTIEFDALNLGAW